MWQTVNIAKRDIFYCCRRSNGSLKKNLNSITRQRGWQSYLIINHPVVITEIIHYITPLLFFVYNSTSTSDRFWRILQKVFQPIIHGVSSLQLIPKGFFKPDKYSKDFFVKASSYSKYLFCTFTLFKSFAIWDKMYSYKDHSTPPFARSISVPQPKYLPSILTTKEVSQKAVQEYDWHKLNFSLSAHSMRREENLLELLQYLRTRLWWIITAAENVYNTDSSGCPFWNSLIIEVRKINWI